MYDIKDRIAIMLFETIEEEKGRRKKQKEDREKKLKEIEDKGVCEGYQGPCENTHNVKWTPSTTRYVWNIDEDPEEDPNRDLFLCPNCAEGYSEEWNDRWREYYGGLL